MKQRYMNDPLPKPAMIIKDMPHMSSFAHQLYNERLEQLTAHFNNEAKLKAAKQELVTKSSERDVTIVPVSKIDDQLSVDLQNADIEMQDGLKVDDSVVQDIDIGEFNRHQDDSDDEDIDD